MFGNYGMFPSQCSPEEEPVQVLKSPVKISLGMTNKDIHKLAYYDYGH